ncbi:MAG: hypothetical protein WA978_11955 [Sphingopyxis granuli]|uniref:hypothetical protein n=1 Tax=Sphingopyxis granuli TaxID=267128 RepID=UPI003C717CF1
MTPEEQAIAEWQAREAARLAELAKFEPLDGVIDLDAANAALEAVDAQISDLETRNRITRIRTILAFDLGALLGRLAQLQVAEPEPLPPPPVPEPEPEE